MLICVYQSLENSDQADTRYLVVTAPTKPQDQGSPEPDLPSRHFPRGAGRPDLTKMQAFLAHGGQAVTYAAGTWVSLHPNTEMMQITPLTEILQHAPMIVVGSHHVDFVVWQYSNGVAQEDCQEVRLEPSSHDGLGAVVVMPSALSSPLGGTRNLAGGRSQL